MSDALETIKMAGDGLQISLNGITGIYGWFIDQFHQVNVGEGVINTSAPVLHITDTDAATAGVEEGNLVVIGTKNYNVIGPVVQTGIGITMLYLSEAI